MFGWFKKKPAAPDFDDRVWIDDAARLDALVRLTAPEGPPVLLLAFFDETLDRVAARLDAAGRTYHRVGTGYSSWRGDCPIQLVNAARLDRLTGALPDVLTVAVAEHHPLPQPNADLLVALEARTATRPVFHVALDEPLMRRFGGDRIAELMVKMGMARDEPIEHALVKRSLADAREKVAAKVRDARDAPSMEAWLRDNLG